MSQSTDITLGSGLSGTDYRTEHNSINAAFGSTHKGNSAPSYAVAGMIWLDDTSTPWVMKIYDGTDWIVIGTVDASTNQFTPYYAGAALAAASTTAAGLVERATDVEAAAGSDTTRYITPKQLADNLLSVTLGTMQATTSGQAVDFSSLPSGIKRISVNFDSVSTDGTTSFFVQIGDSGGLETSGYIATSGRVVDSTANAVTNTTSGFFLNYNNAAQALSGTMTLNLMDASTNLWSGFAVVKNASTGMIISAGSKTLSAELDRVRITTAGSDTLDLGNINISYEV